MDTATNIIFQGVKFYWRTRNTIDVTMVDHVLLQVIEVILFDRSLGMEAPRLYVSSSGLFSKLNHDDIELQQSFAMRNGVPITAKFIDGIMNKARSEYILNRLAITEYSTDMKKIVMCIQLNELDAACLLCEKPDNCNPFKTVHHQHLMAGVVDLAIEALEVEKAKLRTECDNALKTSARVSPLNNKERWRIPIVFVKVAKSKRLQATDAKIWRSVTQNMKTEDDAKNMAEVLDSGLSRAHFSPSSSTAQGPPQPSTKLTTATTPKHSGSVGANRLYCDTAATRLRTHGQDSLHSSPQFRGLAGSTEAASQSQISALCAATGGHSTKQSHPAAGITIAISTPAPKLKPAPLSTAASFNSRKKPSAKVVAMSPQNCRTPKRRTKKSKASPHGRVGKASKPSIPDCGASADTDALTAVLSEEGAVTNAAQTAADAAEDESEGFGTDDGSEDAVAQQGALQRVLAGFTSLRDSFFASISGKYIKSPGDSGNPAEGVPSTSGDGENSAPLCELITTSTATTGAAEGDKGGVVVAGSDKGMAMPLLQNGTNSSVSIDADPPASVAEDSTAMSSNQASNKQKPMTASFLLALFGASRSGSASASSAEPSSDTHIVDKEQKPDQRKEKETARADFSVHKFFADMLPWRANNKVHVDTSEE